MSFLVEHIRADWNTLVPYMEQVAAAAQEKAITAPESLKSPEVLLCAVGTK